MAFTGLSVKKLKPKKTGYRRSDSGGLNIYVGLSGVKSWEYRYKSPTERKPGPADTSAEQLVAEYLKIYAAEMTSCGQIRRYLTNDFLGRFHRSRVADITRRYISDWVHEIK